MMKLITLSFFALVVLSSCINQTDHDKQPNPDAIIKDFNTWWNYNSEKISFAREYKTFDKDSKPISKESFFNNLMSGDYIALKLLSNDTLLQHYQLYPLTASVSQEIGTQSAAFAEREYQKFKLAGTSLPEMNFIDLNGKLYNKDTLKGKIVVLNVWFIECVPCVAEIPALNEIVNEYKSKKDILFLGLTFNSTDALKTFLKKRDFAYNIIPGQEDYIKNKLHIRAYPYQVIINREGKIVSVFEKYEDIDYWLKKEAQPAKD